MAHATSLYLTELNSTDVALTGAGWAARANDATTSYSNPAGMVRLKESQYEVMLMPVYVATDFKLNEDATVNGNTNNADAWLPGASFYYVNKINEKWAAGFAIAGYFGLGLNYDDQWAGRYYINKSILQTIGIQPSIAYEVNNKWSIGFGAILAYTTLEQTFAMNNIEPNLDDGLLTLEDTETSIQYNTGFLYQHSPQTRVGLQYLFETELDFRDIGKFTDLGPILQTVADKTGISGTKVNFGFTLPQSVNLSLYHEINSRWTVLANATWQEWSEFGKITFHAETENDITAVLNKNYDNTHAVSLGLQHQLNSQWQINTGVTYHSAMVSDTYRTPDLPVGASVRYGIGGQKKIDPTSDLKLGYGILWMGDLDLDLERGPLTGRLAGNYESSAMHFFSASYSKKF